MRYLASTWMKWYKKMPVLAYDIGTVPLAWYLSYWLRFNMQWYPPRLLESSSLQGLAILLLVQIGCFYYFKTYRGLWRYASLNDLKRIVKAGLSSVTIALPVFYFAGILLAIPRSILPLYVINLTITLGAGRLLIRHLWDKRDQQQSSIKCERILIIGAGTAGESLIRDLHRVSSYQLIGLLDDDPRKRGLEIRGVRVLGATRDLLTLVKPLQVDLIFIAIPSARSATMRRIVSYCERSKVAFRTLPSLQALALGQVQVDALRKVHIEDLLGRDQVAIAWEIIADNVERKRVLVTGGGGSIGSELCRQIVRLSPKQLVVIDNNEYNLYKIESELRACFPSISFEFSLVSVTDTVAIEACFQRVKPEIVFHAAAYKHVPLLEPQIRSAVYNNVYGTEVVARASIKCQVEKFILISTDKAVNPTNVMGATKRAAEIYCQNLDAQVDTQFITVRFGNVLASVGSVVPLFQQQLQQGGPLTVTHPEMKRYFMTVVEASQLILQAMANGHGGEIFVLDMGEPIKIRYLAEQMIRLAGKEPGKDIQIVYTGLRPGEKLFEELFHTAEKLIATTHEKLFKAHVRRMDNVLLNDLMQQLLTACNQNLDDELFAILQRLVPEFKRSKAVVGKLNRIERV